MNMFKADRVELNHVSVQFNIQIHILYLFRYSAKNIFRERIKRINKKHQSCLVSYLGSFKSEFLDISTSVVTLLLYCALISSLIRPRQLLGAALLLRGDQSGSTSRNTRLPRDVALPSGPCPYMVTKDSDFRNDVTWQLNLKNQSLWRRIMFRNQSKDKQDAKTC